MSRIRNENAAFLCTAKKKLKKINTKIQSNINEGNVSRVTLSAVAMLPSLAMHRRTLAGANVPFKVMERKEIHVEAHHFVLHWAYLKKKKKYKTITLECIRPWKKR